MHLDESAPDKVRLAIGPGGKNVPTRLCEETGCKVDISDDRCRSNQYLQPLMKLEMLYKSMIEYLQLT